MKKVISWVLFILVVVTFVFDIFFAVYGAIDVKNEFDRLAAEGASGVDYFGVGADILVMGIFFLSFVGAILAFISSKLAQSRVVKSISFVLFLLFLPAVFATFFWMDISVII